LFTPFCSHYSGIHTTYFQKIRTDGTNLDHHLTQPLDVIQRMADVQRHNTDLAHIKGDNVQYEQDTVSAATTQSLANLNNVIAHQDHLIKNVLIDLRFMASRAFPMKISVSMVRFIKPQTPYALTTADKQQLLNSLDYKGIEYNDYRVEYNHTFILPALKSSKKIPTYNVIKKIKTNFMQTNAFNNNSVSDDMSESTQSQLGLGIRNRQHEIEDGSMSGNFFILIKYKKVNTPQQFTYHSAIQADTQGVGARNVASIEMPVLTEESFDVPTHAGQYLAGDGSPLTTDQGDESKGSFYVHGSLKYNFGFKEDSEPIPSVMSENDSSTDYNKTQSLNIDPTITGDNTYGIYTQSVSHETRST